MENNKKIENKDNFVVHMILKKKMIESCLLIKLFVYKFDQIEKIFFKVEKE